MERIDATKTKSKKRCNFLVSLASSKESGKIILQWKKLFTQITLSLVLPLSFIFLLHMKVRCSTLSSMKSSAIRCALTLGTKTSSHTHSKRKQPSCCFSKLFTLPSSSSSPSLLPPRWSTQLPRSMPAEWSPSIRS